MINNKVYLIILHLINIFYFRACFRLRPTQLKMEHLEKCDFFSCWKNWKGLVGQLCTLAMTYMTYNKYKYKCKYKYETN